MNDRPVKIALHRLAHARSGDKGNRVNIAVFAYRPALYPLLCRELTAERVRWQFAQRGVSQVQRYLLPRLAALNFVIDGALQGGVNASLNLDGHGKTLSFRLLEIELEVPPELL